MFAVGGFQHGLARLGVVAVLAARRYIDRGNLPLLGGILVPLGQPFLLLFLIAGEPVLEQQQPVLDQQLLELRRGV